MSNTLWIKTQEFGSGAIYALPQDIVVASNWWNRNGHQLGFGLISGKALTGRICTGSSKADVLANTPNNAIETVTAAWTDDPGNPGNPDLATLTFTGPHGTWSTLASYDGGLALWFLGSISASAFNANMAAIS